MCVTSQHFESSHLNSVDFCVMARRLFLILFANFWEIYLPLPPHKWKNDDHKTIKIYISNGVIAQSNVSLMWGLVWLEIKTSVDI